MTPNEFWSRRLWKWECMPLRDFVVSLGCISAWKGDHSHCQGPLDFHHFVKRSHGGSDIYGGCLCRACHSECEKIGNTRFLASRGIYDQSELHQRIIESFLIFIGACGEEIILPEAKRKPKKSSRRPVSENKKAYVKQPWQE